MSTQDTTAGTSPAHDLFVLSDEQILEIAPESQDGVARDPRPVTREKESVARNPWPGTREKQEPAQVSEVLSMDRGTPGTEHVASAPTGHEPRATSRDTAEPPAWLAAQMQDPWRGEEAREFWDGVQQARSEAASYRAAIGSPEDARALKELYPGGVNEARAVAERARLLDDVDRAYFGAAGNSPEQTSASRAQLAQRMLREDPAAFREMVETGIKILQEAAGAPRQSTRSVASAISDIGNDSNVGASSVVAQHAPVQGNQPSARTSGAAHNDAHVAAYVAFERAANEDLERSVGSAIERTLSQALPSFEQHNMPGQAGAQHVAPLRDRLAASVRVDVERALQGDRQLGEQVAQILSSGRFDNEARAQIVRLIGERAQQLVPGAAKRVLNEWTQTTLAAHRGRTQRDDSASAKVEVAPASTPMRAIANSKTQTRSRNINYRKLSDEQILDL